MTQSETYWDKIRLQFDALPYPNAPLERDPRDNPDYLAKHSFTIPYYLRNHQVADTQGKWILDAGCGSGIKLLALAIANPGATVVGIDISSKSVDMAEHRLEYHQIDNPRYFHCLPIEELSSLPYTFDYINCDDVLYLLEDPVVGLQAMKSVLNPEGIIRANMHSSLQRASYYRIQRFLGRLGCLQGAPSPDEIEVTRQMMATLHDWVASKRETWRPIYETDDEVVLANYLLRGDTGITMADYSTIMKKAGLEFISMVNWRQWNVDKLFKSRKEMPERVANQIAAMDAEEKLEVFELLHPVNRLLDVYCGHPGQGRDRPPIDDWDSALWATATIHIHPQLNTDAFKQSLEHGAENLGLIPFDQYLRLDNPEISIDSSFASCLYALLDAPQTMDAMVQRWLQVRPLDLITLEPASPDQAFNTVRNFLLSLEKAGYVMVEIPLNQS